MNGANELQPTTTSYGKYIKFKIVLLLQSPSFHDIIIFVPYLEKLPLKKKLSGVVFTHRKLSSCDYT